MWVLGVLGLVLSCRGAGAFLVHVASSCPLVANGSALDFNLALVFNKNPLFATIPMPGASSPVTGDCSAPSPPNSLPSSTKTLPGRSAPKPGVRLVTT
ncbi:MHC class II M beta chain 1 [Grus japonensis]|uniref:MHC class II M beta chain 1 n=1 Tax=Grus japonensis TaxID=30415 RepID=A0ABC9XVX0_GRUJA